MKGAVIDMGTNTFSLIIFEQIGTTQKIITTDKAFVNLGEGGINQKRIALPAMERAIQAIRKFVEEATALNILPEEIKAYATSAIRDAENSQDFLSKIKDDYALSTTVIDGIEEAKIVYRAVKRIHEFKEESACIMDIGGGSTEFSLIQNKKVTLQKSYNIGLSRISQLFEYSDPLTAADKEKITHFLESQTQGDFKQIATESLIGAAGSFETFFQIMQQCQSYDEFSTHLIPLEQMERILEVLINSSFQERDNNPWIIDYRKDLIHIAALKTKWVMQQLQATQIYYSPASLKEGVMFEYFGEK